MTYIDIPHDQLSRDALRSLIEEFVTRDGTDYGSVETSLERKLDQVKSQIEHGNAFIIYDTEAEICNIISKEQYLSLMQSVTN